MPTVDVAKIKLRRGSNTDRKLVILDNGELGYTTDTNRVYVGNGTLKGGNPVGVNNFNDQSITDISVQNKAEIGDLIFDDYLLYGLSGTDTTDASSWYQISPRVDGTTIQYNSSNTLEVITSGIVNGGNSIDVTGDVVSVDYDTDANTTQFFVPGSGGGASAKMTVNPDGALTDASHGALNEITPSGDLHHTLAIAADEGTAADGFFSKLSAQKLLYAPEWQTTGTSGTTTEEIGGNRVIDVINGGTSLINSARVNLADTPANQLAITTGQFGSSKGFELNTTSISAVDMMTPANFFNREDIPGTILRTAIPAANLDNKGEYSNFTITNVGSSPSDWEDKAFLLPGGDGIIYGVFIYSTESVYNDIIEKYPMVTFTAATYNVNDTVIRENVIDAINSFLNSRGERIFEAWQTMAAADGTVYIQGLVKGKTPTYGTAFAQTNLTGLGTDFRVGGGAGAVFSNTATSIDYNGGTPTSTSVGNNAGNGTTGKVGVDMYGWVNLNTQGSSTFQPTLCSTGFAPWHTIAQFPAGSELTSGEYFLIYDQDYNRTCVYYTVTGTASVVPNISDNDIHRGRKTEFVEVEVANTATSSDVGSATREALNDNEYFTQYYDPNWSSPTLTLSGVQVGYTDGIIKRQGVYPGVTLGTASPVIQFITNYSGLSGEPNVQALNSAFYNNWETSSTATNLPTNGQIFLPQVYDGSIQVYESNGTTSSVAVGALLKYR
tara:strand:- start:1288 stop:3453 length:2166 start_codon:yes stop_codon:yes gene_type:complete